MVPLLNRLLTNRVDLPGVVRLGRSLFSARTDGVTTGRADHRKHGENRASATRSAADSRRQAAARGASPPAPPVRATRDARFPDDRRCRATRRDDRTATSAGRDRVRARAWTRTASTCSSQDSLARVAGAPSSTTSGSARATRPVPDDWVYVHNFSVPDRPNAIRLPAGLGTRFAADMDEFVAGARREIPRAFESDDYDHRRRELLAEASRRQESLEKDLRAVRTRARVRPGGGADGGDLDPSRRREADRPRAVRTAPFGAARAHQSSGSGDRGADGDLRAAAPLTRPGDCHSRAARSTGRSRSSPPPRSSGSSRSGTQPFPRCSSTWSR